MAENNTRKGGNFFVEEQNRLGMNVEIMNVSKWKHEWEFHNCGVV